MVFMEAFMERRGFKLVDIDAEYCCFGSDMGLSLGPEYMYF